MGVYLPQMRMPQVLGTLTASWAGNAVRASQAYQHYSTRNRRLQPWSRHIRRTGIGVLYFGGASMIRRKQVGAAWRRYDYATGEPTVAELSGTGDYSEVVSPNRAPSVGADVGVPLGQSAITGILAGVAVAAVADGLHIAHFWQLLGPAVAVACILAWMWRLTIVSSTLWRVDAVIAEKEPIGSPIGETPTIVGAEHPIVSLAPYRGRQAQARDQADELAQQFSTFVKMCGTPGGTALRRHESRLGREKYSMFRDNLMSSGYAAWKASDQRAGWQLTAPVDVILSACECERDARLRTQ